MIELGWWSFFEHFLQKHYIHTDGRTDTRSYRDARTHLKRTGALVASGKMDIYWFNGLYASTIKHTKTDKLSLKHQFSRCVFQFFFFKIQQSNAFSIRKSNIYRAFPAVVLTSIAATSSAPATTDTTRNAPVIIAPTAADDKRSHERSGLRRSVLHRQRMCWRFLLRQVACTDEFGIEE